MWVPSRQASSRPYISSAMGLDVDGSRFRRRGLWVGRWVTRAGPSGSVLSGSSGGRLGDVVEFGAAVTRKWLSKVVELDRASKLACAFAQCRRTREGGSSAFLEGSTTRKASPPRTARRDQGSMLTPFDCVHRRCVCRCDVKHVARCVMCDV